MLTELYKLVDNTAASLTTGMQQLAVEDMKKNEKMKNVYFQTHRSFYLIFS